MQEQLFYKDWTGNTKSTHSTLGSSSHSEREREKHDYYATEPKAVEFLLKLEKFNNSIWEPACGEGHISNVLCKNGYSVKSTDLINRGFGIGGVDFLSIGTTQWHGDIITNPPYKYAQEFIEKAIESVYPGSKIAMFLKLQFLEGKGRKELFRKFPPKTVYVSSSRLNCALNGQFSNDSSAVCYCWYIWEKGYTGETVIKWFN